MYMYSQYVKLASPLSSHYHPALTRSCDKLYNNYAVTARGSRKNYIILIALLS